MRAGLVRLLPSSPRTRRRLIWLGGTVLVLGVIAGGIALVPRVSEGPRHFSPDPVPPEAAAPHSVRLTASDRRAINATLDRFVTGAVQGHDPLAAYDISTAQMRGGTRADWASGNSPVYPYPARGRHFHGWELNYSYPGDVSLDLMLQPRPGAKVGPIAFNVELKRKRSGWLVDAFVPTASFSPTGSDARVVATPDFQPSGDRNAAAQTDKARLSALWIAVPAGVLGLVLLVPLVFFLTSWVRTRRAIHAAGRS